MRTSLKTGEVSREEFKRALFGAPLYTKEEAGRIYDRLVGQGIVPFKKRDFEAELREQIKKHKTAIKLAEKPMGKRQSH